MKKYILYKEFDQGKTIPQWVIYWLQYLTVNHFIYRKGVWFPFPSLYWSIRKQWRKLTW